MASSISIQFNERDPAYSSLACNTKTLRQNIKLDFVFLGKELKLDFKNISS